MSGQKILARFNKTQIRFFPGDWYPTPPWWALSYLIHFFLGNYSIVTVLERSKTKYSTGDERENSESGKLRILHRISGYGRFFQRKSGSNTTLGKHLKIATTALHPLFNVSFHIGNEFCVKYANFSKYET